MKSFTASLAFGLSLFFVCHHIDGDEEGNYAIMAD